MDDIEFYEKQVKFQENLGKIQQERSKLERQFFQIVRSDKKLQTFHATKLRSYWKEVCERERIARERNETLLRDFADFEDRIRRIQTRSEKLEQTKKQYEDELTRLYPNWRQGIDIAKAQNQLKDVGYEFIPSSSDLNQPAPLAQDSPSIFMSSSLHQNANVPIAKDSLFKLVPCHAPEEKFSNVQEQRQSGTDVTPLEEIKTSSAALDRSAVDKLLESSEGLYRFETAVEDKPAVDVPPLNLPTERSAVTEKTSQPSTSQSTVLNPNYPSNLQNFIPESKSVSPLPMTQTHHYSSGADVVQHVEINATEPRQILPSNSTTSDELDIDTFSDISEVLPASKHKDHAKDFVTSADNRSDSISIPPASEKPPTDPVTSNENLQNLLSPKIATPIQIPQHSVESLPSESGTTETSHKTLPLTSSAAYQHMLKSNEFSSTLGMSKYLDDDDDENQDELEKIVSPKGVATRFSEDDRASSDEDSHPKSSSAYNSVKTVQQSSDAASVKDQFIPRTFPPAKAKAPWDTDSEEDSFDSRDFANKKKMDEDDFEFYD